MPRKPKNPYAGLFFGHFAQKFEEISAYAPDELLIANFHAIQAMLAWEMSSHRQLEGEKRTLIAAVEVLQDQEQVSAEFAQYIQVLLSGWTLERLVRVSSGAQSLPVTAAKLRADGELSVQVRILQEFLVTVLSHVDDRDIRQLGMGTLQQLKLAGGMSQESLDRMLALVEAASTGDEEEDDEMDEEEDDEPEEIDVEAVDVDGDLWDGE